MKFEIKPTFLYDMVKAWFQYELKVKYLIHIGVKGSVYLTLMS